MPNVPANRREMALIGTLGRWLGWYFFPDRLPMELPWSERIRRLRDLRGDNHGDSHGDNHSHSDITITQEELCQDARK